VITYLYAIGDEIGAIDDLRGLAEEPLTLLTFAGFHAAASELPQAPALTQASLAAQDRVVRALHARAEALLPMRFGAAFATPADVARAIDVQREGLVDRLQRVRGREQMNVRVLGSAEATVTPDGVEGSIAPGTNYLRERAQPSAVAPLLQAVAPLVRATIVERGRTAGLIASVYHLIDRGTSDVYREALLAAVREAPALSVHVTGPSPCYAFAHTR
jgi:hypothetical protein